MEVAGPLGTPLGLAQRKRASPRGEAGTSGFLCVSDHNKLWKILQEMGIPDYLICLLINLYAGQEATVRTGYGTTDWFQIGKGVRQGCILSWQTSPVFLPGESQGEPGGLQSMGLLGVGHDSATSLSLFTFMHWRRKWQPTPVFLPGESQGRGSLVGCHLWSPTELDSTEVT